MAKITQQDLDKVNTILSALLDWSGVTDETPDDTELLYSPSGVQIQLGDLREAFGVMHDLGEGLREHS